VKSGALGDVTGIASPRAQLPVLSSASEPAAKSEGSLAPGLDGAVLLIPSSGGVEQPCNFHEQMSRDMEYERQA